MKGHVAGCREQMDIRYEKNLERAVQPPLRTLGVILSILACANRDMKLLNHKHGDDMTRFTF